MHLHRIDAYRWEIPRTGSMRVPGLIYASEELLPQIVGDKAAEQVQNVATLPGIVGRSLAMPDIHWGYGFPIGGVAAFDVDTGVISPGGVGYDINCGVRLMGTNLSREEVEPRIREVITALAAVIPSGVGSMSTMRLSKADERRVLVEGAQWAIEAGYGQPDDLDAIEEGGCMAGADPGRLSPRALDRGRPQLGTLGSGNHFVEVGYVDEIADVDAAASMGLTPGSVTLCIHSGSRGLGYQVCDDYIHIMLKASAKYGIALPDRQLCCAPVKSPEGQAYVGAMGAAVNYAFANRQLLAHGSRTAIGTLFGERRVEIWTVYEVAHNIAKMEEHVVDAVPTTVCVHRKGATRAFGPHRAEVPARYRDYGQPVLVPGDMGRYSYVLLGTQKAMTETFGSACHGAGRMLSRKKAVQRARGRSIAQELARQGVYVIATGRGTLEEEMPEAYKDVSTVVEAVTGAGICTTVARVKPLGCLKG
ncbi:RtcB family protein [Candidatus Fermentibacteria bacterium]|nr:RtcB family protein [Candidatus Fermentibacteria bacterium]